MGVFIILVGGIYWLWKWIEYQVDEEIYEKDCRTTKDYYDKLNAFDKETGINYDYELRLKLEDPSSRIDIISEYISDNMERLYGKDWKELFIEIDMDDFDRQYNLNTYPIGVARMLIMSKIGKLPVLMIDYKNIGTYKYNMGFCIRLMKEFESNLQRHYPEISLMWVAGEEFRSGKTTYLNNIGDGKFLWNFELPRVDRNWHPPIKTLDELSCVDT